MKLSIDEKQYFRDAFELENVEFVKMEKLSDGNEYPVFKADHFPSDKECLVLSFHECDEFGNCTGDVATSMIDFDDYAYTHGGNLFREATELVREIK